MNIYLCKHGYILPSALYLAMYFKVHCLLVHLSLPLSFFMTVWYALKWMYHYLFNHFTYFIGSLFSVILKL